MSENTFYLYRVTVPYEGRVIDFIDGLESAGMIDDTYRCKGGKLAVLQFDSSYGRNPSELVDTLEGFYWRNEPKKVKDFTATIVTEKRFYGKRLSLVESRETYRAAG